MILYSFVALLAGEPSTDEQVTKQNQAISLYLKRCDELKRKSVEQLTKQVEEGKKRKADQSEIERADKKLTAIRQSPPPDAPMSIPPNEGEIGSLAPSEFSNIEAIEMLEAIGKDDSVVRVWFIPPPVDPKNPTEAERITFLDLWIHGMDLRGYMPEAKIKLEGVLQVQGRKVFGTDCGQRSMFNLVPLARTQLQQARVNQ